MASEKTYSTWLLICLFLLTILNIQSCGFMKSKISTKQQKPEYQEAVPYSDPAKSPTPCRDQVENLKADLLQKQDQIAALQDTVRFLEKKIVSLEQLIAQKETAPPKKRAIKKVLPESDAHLSAEALYQTSRKYLQNSQYADAASGFSSFLTRFPRHDLADNALYWLAETYYTQEKYKKAIHHFQSLLENYPRGEKVPDALLKAGYAYMALGDNPTAKQYFSRLLKNYPFSPAAQKAQTKLHSFE